MSPPEKKPASPTKTRLRWIGTLISAALFVWLLARQDWQAVWENLSRLPLWVPVLALGLYFTGMVANALRWYVLLKAPGIRVPFGEVLKIVLLGAFVSNFLPSTIGGDAVRFFSMLRFTGDRAATLASVFLDRLVNVASFFTVLPFTLLTFGPRLDYLTPLAVLASPIFAMAAAPPSGGGRSWTDRLRRLVSRGRTTFAIWLRRPGIVLLALAVSWLSIFVVFLAIWVIARGLGIPVALYQVMGVTAVTYLLTLLPISINGYGVREVAVTALYMQLGGTLEQSSALALITRFLMLLETTPGALWVSDTVPLRSATENISAAEAPANSDPNTGAG